MLISFALVALLGILMLVAARQPVIPIAYVIMSLIAYVADAADKAAQQQGTWRTHESTVHLLAVLGGWPEAMVAQQRLRHKSRKRNFRTVFWLTVIVNCSGLLRLLSPEGARAALVAALR